MKFIFFSLLLTIVFSLSFPPSTKSKSPSFQETQKEKSSFLAVKSHDVPDVVNETPTETPQNNTILNKTKTLNNNNNHNNQTFIDPKGNSFEKVSYVHELSPYAKEDIKEMNNPLRRDKALVGKSFYIENNITFDESPRIFHEIIETQVSGVETPVSLTKQYSLWKNWLGNKHYQQVSYSGQDRLLPTETDPETKRLADREDQKGFSHKKNDSPSEQNNLLNKEITNIDNPLKRQIYSMGYENVFEKSEPEIISEIHDLADDVVRDIDRYHTNMNIRHNNIRIN